VLVLLTTAAEAKVRTPISLVASCFPEGKADASGPPPPQAAAVDAAALSSPSTIDIAFYDTRLRPDASSMLRAAKRCMGTDNSTAARVRFHAILSKQLSLAAFAKSLPGFRLTPLSLPPRAQCLYDGMKRLSHGPGPQYLYKPLLHYVMPADVHRLILLDTDVVMVRDVRELHAEFDLFGTALLGIAKEQSRLMEPLPGTNGGVQLLDLQKMRSSVEYNGLLDHVATGADGRRIGYLGDQTLYTYLIADKPELFYWLPCEWNRQISAHFGFHNASVHECPRRCGILHANFQPFKCIAWLMHASPSCSVWKGFADALTEPLSATHSCPRAQAAMRKTFKPALLNFFADCCVPDGAVYDAHGSRTQAEYELAKKKGMLLSQLQKQKRAKQKASKASAR